MEMSEELRWWMNKKSLSSWGTQICGVHTQYPLIWDIFNFSVYLWLQPFVCVCVFLMVLSPEWPQFNLYHLDFTIFAQGHSIKPGVSVLNSMDFTYKYKVGFKKDATQEGEQCFWTQM